MATMFHYSSHLTSRLMLQWYALFRVKPHRNNLMISEQFYKKVQRACVIDSGTQGLFSFKACLLFSSRDDFPCMESSLLWGTVWGDHGCLQQEMTTLCSLKGCPAAARLRPAGDAWAHPAQPRTEKLCGFSDSVTASFGSRKILVCFWCLLHAGSFNHQYYSLSTVSDFLKLVRNWRVSRAILWGVVMVALALCRSSEAG